MEEVDLASMSKEDKAKHKKKLAKKKAKTKAKKARAKLLPGSHRDAVLGLSWNADFRNVLATGSADRTVKVWDVTTQQCVHTLTHHSDKVQSVAWNPGEATVLLTGAFDKSACLADARAAAAPPLTWKLTADVECLAWDPHAPFHFAVSTEDGLVSYRDVRGGASAAPLFSLSAHDKPTCCVSFSPGQRGLMLTGSTDKRVKAWDVAAGAPELLTSKDLKVGAVFALGFCGDLPFTCAAAGAKGTVCVWDTLADDAVASKYGRK